MNRLSKYQRLSAAERSLLLQAATRLAVFRLGLWLLPYPVLRRLMQRHLPTLPLPASVAALPADRLAWAVCVASRAVPAATCLTQALALHSLLTAAGHPARIQIGVAKHDRLGLQAHAWVESGGRAFMNAPDDLAQYARLGPLEVAAK